MCACVHKCVCVCVCMCVCVYVHMQEMREKVFMYQMTGRKKTHTRAKLRSFSSTTFWISTVLD